MAKQLFYRSEKVLRSRLGQSIACSQRQAAGGATATAWTSQRHIMGCCHTANGSLTAVVTDKAAQSQHAAFADSAAYHSSIPAADQEPQPAQDSPLSGSYVHLGLRQERINHDGSLTTAYTYHRQQQMPHATSPISSVGPNTQTSGSVSSRALQQTLPQQQRGVTVSRPPGLPSAAPAAPPITQQQLSHLVDLLQNHRNVLVITGAGCSTESNIPDYRGPSGAYTTGFTPMTHQQFVAKPENRAR
eukprot:GHUV01009411.1.p1 GENE.GHUV01009411.1~~GHUV01009411.1.p1  ORF type:complete len:245 (+),score=42.24 GHUV01009411.1:315-1049(+)